MYHSKNNNIQQKKITCLSKEQALCFLVDENLDYVLKELNRHVLSVQKDEDFCGCMNCLLDILALTLNKSPSRYRLLGRHAHKEWADVQSVCQNIRLGLKEAIAIVKKNPHHE